MDIVCSVRNLIIGALFLVLASIWLYAVNASTTTLFLLLIPLVLGLAFLVLWGFTTATGLAGYGKLFLLIYVISLGAIELAAWWTFCRAQPDTVVQVDNNREAKYEEYRG